MVSISAPGPGWRIPSPRPRGLSLPLSKFPARPLFAYMLHQFLVSNCTDRQTDKLTNTQTDGHKNNTCFTQHSWHAGNDKGTRTMLFNGVQSCLRVWIGLTVIVDFSWSIGASLEHALHDATNDRYMFPMSIALGNYCSGQRYVERRINGYHACRAPSVVVEMPSTATVPAARNDAGEPGTPRSCHPDARSTTQVCSGNVLPASTTAG